ncbi:hypothetical protein BKA80DRAFT_257519 [Phyllosticta citrichinensis]
MGFRDQRTCPMELLLRVKSHAALGQGFVEENRERDTTFDEAFELCHALGAYLALPAYGTVRLLNREGAAYVLAKASVRICSTPTDYNTATFNTRYKWPQFNSVLQETAASGRGLPTPISIYRKRSRRVDSCSSPQKVLHLLGTRQNQPEST